MSQQIPLGRPYLSKDLILEEISKVLDTRWISGGPTIAKFEEALQNYIGGGPVVAVANGTVAIEMALIYLNNGKRFTEEDEVQITRKIHGTNARYGIVKKSKLSFWDNVKKFFGLADEWIDYEYIYGSHNCEKGSESQGFYSTDVWRTIAEKYQIKEKLWRLVREMDVEEVGSGVVLYGEIFGAGIQKNYDYGLEDIQFNGFDLTVNGEYLSIQTAYIAIYNLLELPHVEELYVGPWNQEIQDSFVFKNFIEGTKVPHEGIVIKHISGERNKVAKVINPDYLIYGEKHNVGDSH